MGTPTLEWIRSIKTGQRVSFAQHGKQWGANHRNICIHSLHRQRRIRQHAAQIRPYGLLTPRSVRCRVSATGTSNRDRARCTRGGAGGAPKELRARRVHSWAWSHGVNGKSPLAIVTHQNQVTRSLMLWLYCRTAQGEVRMRYAS